MLGEDTINRSPLTTIRTIRSAQYVTIDAIQQAWLTTITPGQHQLLFNSLCDIITKINKKKLPVSDNVFKVVMECLECDRELFIKPSILKAIERNCGPVSLKCWEVLLDHPFTPTLAKTNTQFYVTCIASIITSMTECKETMDKALLQKTMDQAYLRLVYSSNKKKSYSLTVEHLLTPLLSHYPDPELCPILSDTVLSHDNLTQLEAYLIANMSNFAKLLVDKMRTCDNTQCVQLFKTICKRVRSRNKSRLLLNLYLQVNNKDIARNELLLHIIEQERLYQIKEDKEQGNVITQFLEDFMSQLKGTDYSRICVKVLPLNHYIVKVVYIIQCGWLDDELLETLFTVYSKLGELLNLFMKLYEKPWYLSKLEKKSKARLQQISCKLTTYQVLSILELHITQMSEINSMKNEECAEKRAKVDSGPVCFMAECTHVVLTYNRSIDINSVEFREKMLALSNLIPSLAPAAQTSLNLCLTELVKCGKLDTALCPVLTLDSLQSSTAVQLFIQQLGYSTDLSHDLDLLLEHSTCYWGELLSSIHLLYDMLSSDHLLRLGEAILRRLEEECEVTISFITSNLFSRLLDLHSCLIHLIMRLVNTDKILSKLPSDVLVDLSMSKARELVKFELDTGAKGEVTDVQYGMFTKVLQQIPPSCPNSCHLKKMCVAWQISRRYGGAVKLLTVLCRPPTTFVPLPQLHGVYSGKVLVDVLKGSSSDDILCFLEEYLSSGLLIMSVDLTELLNYFISGSDDLNKSLKICCKMLLEKAGAVERYRDKLSELHAVIEGRISEDDSKAMFNLLSSQSMLSTILNKHFTHFNTCITSLNNSAVPTELKIDLICTLSQHSGEEELPSLITTLVSIISPDTISYLPTNFLNNDILKHLINLLPSYPEKVELILNQSKTQITYKNLESLKLIPLSLLPGMMSSLTKQQVLESLFAAEDPDPLILTKCMLLMLQQSYPIHCLTPIISKTMKVLLEHSSPASLSQLTRVCEQIAKQKDAARHHSPYILLMLFNTMSRGTSEIISGVTPATYPLLGVIALQGLQFLGARLSGASKELFTTIHNHYKDNVKYQGKT